MNFSKIAALGLCALLSACSQRYSDSAKFTAPPGYDSTIGTCNPSYAYPPNSPCSNPQPPVTGSTVRLTVDTIGCAARYSYTQNSMTFTGETQSFDKTINARSGDIFAIVAQSTCGAGGSATVRIYRGSTLAASDSKVGPNVATAGINF